MDWIYSILDGITALLLQKTKALLITSRQFFTMGCRDSSNSSVTFANCGTVFPLHKRHSCLQITSVQQRWGPICFLPASHCLICGAGEYQLAQSARPPGLVFWEAQLGRLGSNALVCLVDLGKLSPKGIASHLHFSSELWELWENNRTHMYRPSRGVLLIHVIHACKGLQPCAECSLGIGP